MHYHIILTEVCNSRCRYCYEKSMKEFDNGLKERFDFDFSQPSRFNFDIQKLKNFLLKDPNPVLIFYGGEPLLEIEKIKKIIDTCSEIKNIKFRMQTNGKLLKKLPLEYLKKIKKILVSIDGNKEITNYNRGNKTYEKVIENLINLKNKGYEGEIIARMTLPVVDFNKPGRTDIFEQVKHLIEDCEFKFSSIHWQLDAGFYKFDFNEEIVNKFFKEYNKSVSKLIDYWINNIEKSNVLKIYPFLGVVNRLLGFDKENCLQCGAGKKGYGITTSGSLVACPIMNNIKNFEAGDLNKISDLNSIKKFSVQDFSEMCKNCNVKDICGGRCLYWQASKLWPEKGNNLICDSIKHLINELKKQIPRIEKAINNKKINKKELKYEKYFGPEIIP